eukprot:3272027-Prymnesium_polylepis.1
MEAWLCDPRPHESPPRLAASAERSGVQHRCARRTYVSTTLTLDRDARSRSNPPAPEGRHAAITKIARS